MIMLMIIELTVIYMMISSREYSSTKFLKATAPTAFQIFYIDYCNTNDILLKDKIITILKIFAGIF